jgi:hypothetical protein
VFTGPPDTLMIDADLGDFVFIPIEHGQDGTGGHQ